MCQIVVINRGEVEIGTPKEFKTHFGFEPIGYEQESEDCCLCPIDLEKTFEQHSIPFKTDCGDYYVGELELVIGDND